MRAKPITDQEAEEVGVKKEVFQDWADLMQALWTASIALFQIHNENPVLYPVQDENEIMIGETHTIKANLVNNKYVEAQLWKGDIQLAKIRYTGNVNTVCKCFGVIIKDDLQPAIT